VRELRRVLYVLEIQDLSQAAVVSRDLLLVKVLASPTDRASIAQVCEVFRARIVNVATGSVIVEATGSDEKLDGLLSVLVPYGIEEMARTGPVVLGRGDDAAGKALQTSSWRARLMQAAPLH
jgi:acetolactate synthase-1/3 small subunit